MWVSSMDDVTPGIGSRWGMGAERTVYNGASHFRACCPLSKARPTCMIGHKLALTCSKSEIFDTITHTPSRARSPGLTVDRIAKDSILIRRRTRRFYSIIFPAGSIFQYTGSPSDRYRSPAPPAAGRWSPGRIGPTRSARPGKHAVNLSAESGYVRPRSYLAVVAHVSMVANTHYSSSFRPIFQMLRSITPKYAVLSSILPQPVDIMSLRVCSQRLGMTPGRSPKHRL
jgi:hypothetical protein